VRQSLTVLRGERMSDENKEIDKVITIDINKEMQKCYIDYAMSMVMTLSISLFSSLIRSPLKTVRLCLTLRKPLKRLDQNFIQILHFFQKYKIFILIYCAAERLGKQRVFQPESAEGALPTRGKLEVSRCLHRRNLSV
jgi:hypothetical protein